MIAIIACCGANLLSVEIACERLGVEVVLTTDPQVITQAEKVILPGVGTAHHGMQQLQNTGLVQVIQTLKQPVLGICLGMQLLFEFSAEGDVNGLGILPGKITRFPPDKHRTVPHMGWNQLLFSQPDHPLLYQLNNQDYVYFVHSYFAPISNNTVAYTDYGIPFSAIVQKNNFFGMQFHPERSGRVGQKLLQNFITMSCDR